MESERGWGSERWHEDYDTFQQAQERINSVNSKNTALTVPDWYMIAEEKIEAICVDET